MANFCSGQCIYIIWGYPEKQRISTQLVKKIHLQCRRPWFNSWVKKICWRRDRPPTPVFLDFPDGSDGKESTCSAGNLRSIPELGSYPGGGHGNPLQYSCLENPMDKGAWWVTIQGLQRVRHQLKGLSMHTLQGIWNCHEKNMPGLICFSQEGNLDRRNHK